MWSDKTLKLYDGTVCIGVCVCVCVRMGKLWDRCKTPKQRWKGASPFTIYTLTAVTTVTARSYSFRLNSEWRDTVAVFLTADFLFSNMCRKQQGRKQLSVCNQTNMLGFTPNCSLTHTQLHFFPSPPQFTSVQQTPKRFKDVWVTLSSWRTDAMKSC